MKTNDCSRAKRLWIAIGLLGVTMLYATLRYCVAGSVAWSQFPSYIVNKASAVLGLAYFTMTAWAFVRDNKQAVRDWGRLTTTTVLIHALLSFGLFSVEYYPTFFVDKHLTFGGNVILVMGVIGLVMMTSYGQWQQFARIRLTLIALLSILHVLPMGFPGWFQPETWQGGLPPISLLSFLLGCFTLFLLTRRITENPEPKNKPQ